MYSPRDSEYPRTIGGIDGLTGCLTDGLTGSERIGAVSIEKPVVSFCLVGIVKHACS